MTTLLEIKPYIHDYIEANLDAAFGGKVYWIAERKNIPSYPYCLLNVIAESKDKRTSRHFGEVVDDKVEKIITRYKTCTITVGVYNGFAENTAETYNSRYEAKEFAYEQIDNLEGAFEDYPINNKFSVQNISPIRPLHEVVDGGYLYRYEFDLTIGYNEPRVSPKDLGIGVDVDIDVGDNSETNDDIGFIVTIDDNDNIEIEYK